MAFGGQSLQLDGSGNHIKKDVNGDGVVGSPAAENIYPRGDFNGDGMISLTATRQVPGVVGAAVTDLDMLLARFADRDYAVAEVPNLILSGDLHLNVANCIAPPGVVSFRVSLSAVDAFELNRVYPVDETMKTYTVPVTGAFLLVQGLNANGDVVSQSDDVPILPGLGGEVWSTPHCVPPPDLPATPTNLVATSPVPGQVVLQWNDASSNELRFEVAEHGAFKGEVGANITTITFSGLNPGSSYHWDVRACNSFGCSPWHGVVGKTPDGSDGAVTFDPVADYDAGWLSGSNPNGVWRYGWSSTLQSPVTLYTQNYTTTQDCPGSTYRAWNDPSNNVGFTPAVIKNNGPTCSNGNVVVPNGVLSQHFGGAGAGINYAHVIFTAPSDGTYIVSITFTGRQNGVNSDVNVLVNGNLVRTGVITANLQTVHYSATLTLSAGDKIDFATGPGTVSSLHSGHVGLSGTIVRQ